MKKPKSSPSGEYIHLQEISELIGVTFRSGQNYAKIMRENYPEQYEEIVQERKRPGQGGRAKKMYKADPGIEYFSNIRDQKPIKQPETIEVIREIAREEIKNPSANRPPVPIEVDELDFESKERLVRGICEEYQNNEKSIKKICYENGVRITSFMKLIVNNSIFKDMFEESNKIRKHVLVAELEFYEHQSLLDKMRPKRIKTTEVISDIEPEFHEDGTYSLKEIPKGKKERNKDYVPSPMAIALSGKIRSELLQEITDGTGEITMPNFEEMTPEERRSKIEALRNKLNQRRLAG